jgi:ankyrin repeat protein
MKNWSWQRLMAAADQSTGEIAGLLLDRGADVNVITTNGLTPLMCASEPDFVRMLIDKGADVHATDRQGRSVLYHNGRYLPTTRVLLEKGARPQKNEAIAIHALSCDFPCPEARHSQQRY